MKSFPEAPRRRLLDWTGPLLAGGAGIAGAIPGGAGAWTATFCALGALSAQLFFRPRHRSWFLATLALSLCALVLSWPELRPLPLEPESLARAGGVLERRWAAELARLEKAVERPPPEGGDFNWLHQRGSALGSQAGIALLAFPSLDVAAWSGWTTLLSEKEEETLIQQLQRGASIIVLRRGLQVRLAMARLMPGGKNALLAEIPLPPEPDLGPIGEDVEPAVLARVRWESLGEGLRAPIGQESQEGSVSDYWSMIPLMAGPTVAGRVTLGLVAPSTVRARQSEKRCTWSTAVLAAILLALALVGGGPSWLLVLAARGALALGVHWPMDLEQSGLDAALNGVTVLLLLLLIPLPVSRRGRFLTGTGGVALLFFGGGIAWWVTATWELAPLEFFRTQSGGFFPVLSWAVALAALPVAGAWLSFHALFLRRWSVPLFAAALGGVAGGWCHGQALILATQNYMQRVVVPEIAGRQVLWEQALRGTLRLAVPPGGEELLAAERDAIDLWWNSPLAQRGLACGVWKMDAQDRLEDLFLTGMPPGDVPGALQRAQVGPDQSARLNLKFLGGDFQVLARRVERPGGGSWVVAVLDEPGNLPSRNARDPLRGIREIPPAPAGPIGIHDVLLAWSDRSGRLLRSDLTSGPPPLRAPPAKPTWRTVTPGTRSLRLLDIGEPQGVVTVITFPPGSLTRTSLALSWGLAMCLLVGALKILRALLGDPRKFLHQLAQAAKQVTDLFRVQVGIALAAAGLLPLLVLGISGRTVARQQATQWLNAEGARSVLVAQRFLDDFLALEAGRETTIDDDVAAWMARTLGDDVFTWSHGLLLATSRSDLERAGLLPGRLEGRLWEDLTRGGSSLVVQNFPTPGDESEGAWMVAHGSFRGSGESPGVVSVSLGPANRRIGRGLVQVYRALLVSAVLLFALTALLLRYATGRLVRPLAQLERATQQIQLGRFETKIPATGFAETRTLALAFQEMAHSLALQQQTLERRQETIERLIASMPVAVLAVTDEGRVWAANPRGTALCAARPGEPLATRGSVLFEAFGRVMQPSTETTETVEVTMEGQTRHLHLSALPLPRQTEKEPSRLLVIEDLTDSLRSERLAAWAEMARRIAHEIKNPLTPISLVVEHARQLMKEGHPQLPETMDRCLAMIADQVQVLRDTALEFSDYARMLQARPEPVHLPGLISEWLAPYRLTTPSTVRLVVEGPENLPRAAADPRLLRRAVINLLDNALAAVSPKGTVLVSWFQETGPSGRIGLAVKDDGPGLDPAQRARLYEPGATTRETGSGLGLPIARQAVEAQGGTLEMETETGKGTCFTIFLPVA